MTQPKPLFKDFQNDSENKGKDFTASLEAIGPEGDEGDKEDVARQLWCKEWCTPIYPSTLQCLCPAAGTPP